METKKYNLEAIRVELKIKQEDVAAAMGYSRRTWQNRCGDATLGGLVDFVIAIGGNFDFETGLKSFIVNDRIFRIENFISKKSKNGKTR